MDLGSSDKLGWPLAGTWAGVLTLTVIGLHLPWWPAWLLNTAVILGTAAAVARYKRSRPVWACFWVLAAVCAVIPVLSLIAGLMNGYWTGTDWVLAVIEAGTWYWLLRFPRARPAVAPQATHVIVHHIVHGALGQAAASVPSQIMRDAVPEEVIRGAVPGVVERAPERRAIAAAPGRLGKMAEALKSYVRR